MKMKEENKLKAKSENERLNLRFNMLTTFTYIVGIILLVQLFTVQIVNGTEYRQTSNTKLTRESTIEAVRGSILDSSGNVLVSTDMTFSLEMYKTKVEDKILNDSISLMTKILRQNEDEYVDNFPISVNPYEYHFDNEEKLKEWKKTYKIPETASAQEAFYLFRDKYKIDSEDVDEIRRILAIRYEISTKGYSTTKSISISKEITRNSAVQLQENGSKLTGVNVVVEPVRVYHTGNLASHIIGYMGKISDKNKEAFKEKGDDYKYENDDKVGQSGIEKVFEEYLRGTDGIKQIDMDVKGTITGEYTAKEAIGGADIVLTIDANLQKIAQEALERNVVKIREGGFEQQYNAEGGSVVVTNVKTGEILAMASYPDYEPELFYNGISKDKYAEYNATESYKPLYNRATSGIYPPGSTFKMVTGVAALESGVIGRYDKINDDGPYIVSDDPNFRNPRCWLFNSYGHGHGRLNVSDAIKKSCNYYFYDVSNRMGIEKLAEYARYFGLGNKTGIELSESSGILAERSVAEQHKEVWSKAYTASASIGQSYNSFTPIQMAKYISMIANGGHPIDLSIVKNVIKSDGTRVAKGEIDGFVNKTLNRTIERTEDKNLSQDTMDAIHEGMKSVAQEEGGTAYNVFKDFEIEIGGKTGSAELTNNKNVNDAIGWFAGYAPYDNPEIAIVVMVEKGGHGSYTAEVVRDIMSEYFGMNKEVIVEDMTVSSEMESFR